MPSHELVTKLRFYLARELADRMILHGVFMEVMSVGVLITGESSVGKSELALELVSRGHRLIADDAPEFRRIAPDTLEGRCPPVLQDFLEVRGLGILNIRQMYGDASIKRQKFLRLIIHLRPLTEESQRNLDRINGESSTTRLLGVEITETTLPVAPGRNLGVMVEAAVRNFLLHEAGYNAAEDMIGRQKALLGDGD